MISLIHGRNHLSGHCSCHFLIPLVSEIPHRVHGQEEPQEDPKAEEHDGEQSNGIQNCVDDERQPLLLDEEVERRDKDGEG